MTEPKNIFTPEERMQVKREIVETISRICTGDACTCVFGYCVFNKKCAKPFFEVELLPNQKHRIKSLLKNVRAKEKRKNGRPPGPSGQNHSKYTPQEWKSIRDGRNNELLVEASKILGQNILEHDLIKGDDAAIYHVKQCTSIKGIVILMSSLYEKKTGRKMIFGSRHLYRRYYYENAKKKVA